MNRLRDMAAHQVFQLAPSPLSAGGHYYFSDLVDRNLYVNRDAVKAYDLPTVSSPLVFIFSYGDPVPVYSFIKTGGRLWVQIKDYTHGGYAYIPLDGEPGSSTDLVPVATLNSALVVYGVPTAEQQQQNQQQDDSSPFQPLIDAVKGTAGLVLAAALLYYAATRKP